MSLRAQSRSETQTQTRETGDERSRSTDSLRQVLKTSAQDTNRVNILNNLAAEISSYDIDTAIIIIKQGLSLSQKLKWKKGEATAEFRLGAFNFFKSNHKEAFDHYYNALNCCEILISSQNPADAKAGKKIKGRTIGNMSNVYRARSDYPKALEYSFKSLKIAEEVGDKQQAGITLVNIANVYFYQQDYPKALEYYFKGLKIAEEAGNKLHVGIALGNIANVYYNQADYPKALEYFFNGLKIAEEVGDKQGIGITLGNIANIYHEDALSAAAKGNNTLADEKDMKALEYYLKGLKVSEEIGDKLQVGIALGNIGSLYSALGNDKQAEAHLKRALRISKEIGAEELERNHHSYLFMFYEQTKRPALALEHYKKFIALRDTIYSQENTKKLMRSEMDHEYERKKAVIDAEHNMEIQNQKLITDEKNKKQNIVIGSVIAGLILVMIFSGFVFRSLRTTRKQKQIIELKNIETEHQKKEIEMKQKDILDSIYYARRIQKSLMSNEKYIENKLKHLNHL